MSTDSTPRPNLARAEQFIWHSARLLERLRFGVLFRGGGGERVLDALLPYQNPDGGFGEALEPDFRGPISQPLTTEMGLSVLAEIGRFDHPSVPSAYTYLQSISTPEGGVPNTVAATVDYPHAFWWAPAEGTPADILPTGLLLGVALAQGLDHPWVEPAARFCWNAVEELLASEPDPSELGRIGLGYRARAALAFLDHAPERGRAGTLAAELGRVVQDAGAVKLEPGADGELATPLDFAPAPGSLAYGWFDDTIFAAHLDALVAAQDDDGGWPVPWMIWTPAAEPEWPGDSHRAAPADAGGVRLSFQVTSDPAVVPLG